MRHDFHLITESLELPLLDMQLLLLIADILLYNGATV